MEALQKLDQELNVLKSVKAHIREIAALHIVEQMRRSLELTTRPPSLHGSCTGRPETGKTTMVMGKGQLEALQLHRGLCGADFVAIDFVEVSPAYDPT